jgi:probable rRNA maturation factor
MAGLELQITDPVPAGFDAAPLRAVFGALLASLDEAPDGTINLAFVDDERIRAMNRDQAGNDYATDVLSFSYIEDGGEPIDGVIGEMVISLETAARQAEAAGTALAEEVALLALHGTLHILGHDHQTPEQQDQLQHLQRRLMTAAGYQYREFKWEN